MFDRIPLFLAQEDAPPTRETPSVGPAPINGAPPAADQTTTGQPLPPTNGTPDPGTGSSMFGPLFFLVVIGIFWFVLMGGQRREKKRRAAMLAQLEKGKKVVTIGGIIGTVVEVRETEVVVKVDDNTRIKFARSAIQTVVEDEKPDA